MMYVHVRGELAVCSLGRLRHTERCLINSFKSNCMVEYIDYDFWEHG